MDEERVTDAAGRLIGRLRRAPDRPALGPYDVLFLGLIVSVVALPLAMLAIGLPGPVAGSAFFVALLGATGLSRHLRPPALRSEPGRVRPDSGSRQVAQQREPRRGGRRSTRSLRISGLFALAVALASLLIPGGATFRYHVGEVLLLLGGSFNLALAARLGR